MATTAFNDIFLEGPEHYYSWFSNIKGSVPEDLWKYFDPETTDKYTELEVVTVATLQPEATSLQQLSTVDRTLYAQLRTIYNNDVSQYQRYLGEKAKLRTKLLNTVPEAKRVLLPADESISNWDIYKASSELKQTWDQRLIRTGMTPKVYLPVRPKGVKLCDS